MKRIPSKTNMPDSMDRLGWHKFYVNRFNRNPNWQAEQLACWYLFLHLSKV